jgi:predicted double-glycine peptidase
MHPSVVLPVRKHLQNREYTCGPAALRIILETLDVHTLLPSETTIAKWCFANDKNGTDPDNMVTVLKRLEVQHTVSISASLGDIERSIRRFELCLVDYQAHDDGSKDGHYSVIFGFDETHFYIADPYKKKVAHKKEWGFRRIRKDLFEGRWHARHSDGARVIRWMIAVPLANTMLKNQEVTQLGENF